MLIKTDIRSSYTAKEIAAAHAYLNELQFISKPMIALNERNKEAILTVLIGEKDEYEIAPLYQAIQEKCHEYISVFQEESNNKKNSNTPESLKKTALSLELVKLNQLLEEKLPEHIYTQYTSKYNTIAAFYPSSEFLHVAEKGEAPRVADPKSFDFSAVLSSDIGGGYNNISVSPPTSAIPYTHIVETFNDLGFLVFCIKAGSASVWSKYTNGRSIPMSINWGLFLLTLGIHPLYKLEHRPNFEEILEKPLFKDVFPNFKETFNFDIWNRFKKHDLLPYEPARKDKSPQHEVYNQSALREEFATVVDDWYKQGNSIKGFKTAKELLDTVFKHHEELQTDYKKWKDVNNIILELGQKKAFSQTLTRSYIAGFAIPHKISKKIDKHIFDLSSVASFLHFEANPSCNMYVMLRFLADKAGDADVISNLTGISPETWVRYEQGTRVPHSAAWTSILLSLDIHPIYKVIKRTDPEELSKTLEIYKDLHLTAIPKKSEFYLPQNAKLADILAL